MAERLRVFAVWGKRAKSRVVTIPGPSSGRVKQHRGFAPVSGRQHSSASISCMSFFSLKRLIQGESNRTAAGIVLAVDFLKI